MILLDKQLGKVFVSKIHASVYFISLTLLITLYFSWRTCHVILECISGLLIDDTHFLADLVLCWRVSLIEVTYIWGIRFLDDWATPKAHWPNNSCCYGYDEECVIQRLVYRIYRRTLAGLCNQHNDIIPIPSIIIKLLAKSEVYSTVKDNFSIFSMVHWWNWERIRGFVVRKPNVMNDEY